MAYGELTLPPIRASHNKQTGRFMKGHTPANKGKKWSEWMGKRAQKRAAKGWANLDKYRPTTRPDNAGRCRKQVIAVLDDGRWVWFPHIGSKAESHENLETYLTDQLTCTLDWDAVEDYWREVNMDEWQAHGFIDAADYHRYRGF